MSDTQEEQTTEETTRKLGVILKEHREKNGHNIHEVAEALCLSPEVVTALEAEDYDSLPEPPYIRGYLRSYAKFSEIDPEEIIALYEKQRGADPKDLEYHFKPSSNGALSKPAVSPATIRLGLIALLLVALASISMIPAVNSWISETWAGFSAQTAQKNYADVKDDNVATAITYEAPAPLPDDAAQESAALEVASTDDTPVTDEQATEESDAKPEDAKKDEEETADDKKNNKEKTDDDVADDDKNNDEVDKSKEDAEQTIKTEGDTKLKFVFKSDVWMRIKDKNNKTVFESLSPAGEEKEIKLNKPMTFRIGNAGGVTIFVEGKALDIKEFTKGSVANFTIE